MISAGVMAANFSWNAKYSKVGIPGARAVFTSCIPMVPIPSKPGLKPMKPLIDCPNTRL